MKLLAKPPSSKWPFTRRSFTELRRNTAKNEHWKHLQHELLARHFT